MKRKREKISLMHIRMPEDLRRLLIVEAARRDVGRAALVELAIRKLLKAPKEPEAA